MKYNFKSSLLYSTAVALSLYACDAFATGNGAPIKKTPPKIPHQVTGRLQADPSKQKVNFFRSYPPEWNKLSVRNFFSNPDFG